MLRHLFGVAFAVAASGCVADNSAVGPILRDDSSPDAAREALAPEAGSANRAMAKDSSPAEDAVETDHVIAESSVEEAAVGNDADIDTAPDGEEDATPDGAPPYNPCPDSEPCAVMPLGDSITLGYGSSGGGYRAPLFHRAVADGRALTFVGSRMDGPAEVDNQVFPNHHEGHSGYTIDDGGGRKGISPLVDAALTKYKPNIITLMIGTNDVDIALDPPNLPKRLGLLLDRIADGAPDALLIVAQITPTTDDTQNIDVRSYNAAIPALVRERADAGRHIAMVDMYGAFTARASFKGDFMSDKLHPKDAGYVVMGDVWYTALAPYLH